MDQKLRFENWMKEKGLKRKSIKNYITGISTIINTLKIDIYKHTTIEDVDDLLDSCFNKNNIKGKQLDELNSRGHNMYSSALKKYIQFVKCKDGYIKDKPEIYRTKVTLNDTNSTDIANRSFTKISYKLNCNNSHTRKLKERYTRHNIVIKKIANILEAQGFEIKEGNIDCLAIKDEQALLIEVKSLDNNYSDEIKQVRQAYSQLDYYEEFALGKYRGHNVIKVAIFERKISDEHISFMENRNKLVFWIDNDKIDGSKISTTLIKNLNIDI